MRDGSGQVSTGSCDEKRWQRDRLYSTCCVWTQLGELIYELAKNISI